MRDEWAKGGRVRLRSARTVSWLLVFVGLAGLEWGLLNGVRQGGLFLFAAPFDRPATAAELRDARDSADWYRLPAVLCIGAFVALGAWATRGGIAESLRSLARQLRRLLADHALLAWIFLLATVADLASTLWFFHARGIELELHPGIRLFGYAFGRTAGPLIGKGVQFVGILAIAALLPRIAPLILVLATATYFLAVVYNVGLFQVRY